MHIAFIYDIPSLDEANDRRAFVLEIQQLSALG